jgi:hypothetical protein
MPSWLTEVLKVLGFTTPFIYAGATYGFFHWLDKKASGPAKRAISGWLEPKDDDKAAVQAAVLELFDRVYTTPLLTWRAFFRSAVITLVVLILFIYDFAPSPLDIIWSSYYTPTFFNSVLNNAISDYVALFAIRRMLANNSLSSFKAMLAGPLVGIGIVVLVRAIQMALLIIVLSNMGTLPTGQDFDADQNAMNLWIAAAALFVHLWLPFFALCVGLLKGLNYFLLATKQVQWFLKRGKDHPLDALGLVATPLFGAAAVQMLVSK